MVINPSLLFLDEPTSGLDSTTASVDSVHVVGTYYGWENNRHDHPLTKKKWHHHTLPVSTTPAPSYPSHLNTSGAVVPFPSQHLRCHVRRFPTLGMEQTIVLELLRQGGQSKIQKFQVYVFVEEYIFRLEIPVGDAAIVAEINCVDRAPISSKPHIHF
nr:ABC transporter G family member 9 [Ipomoea batatas]